VVQGITEWLPISSEGINTLILIHLFDKPSPEAIATSIWLHLGTLLAAVIYFRKEVVYLLQHLPQYARERGASSGSEPNVLITFLVVSTVLTGVLGAPLLLINLDQEEMPAETITAIIGVLLIITGLVQKYARMFSGTRTNAGIKDAFLLGVVQAFSALPGLSRSGLTVSALLIRGYEAGNAMRLSFLMSIPVILAAVIGIGLIGDVSFDSIFVSSVITAFIFGILTIGVLIRIASRVAFWKFCIFLGALSMLPLLIEKLG
jgi:undecaprenyl-diphosphatase